MFCTSACCLCWELQGRYLETEDLSGAPGWDVPAEQIWRVLQPMLTLLSSASFSSSPPTPPWLSNGPPAVVQEWASNSFHLCASVMGLSGRGLLLFIHPPPSSPLQLKKFESLVPLRSLSFQARAPPGPRQQGEFQQPPRFVGPWILEILARPEMGDESYEASTSARTVGLSSESLRFHFCSPAFQSTKTEIVWKRMAWCAPTQDPKPLRITGANLRNALVQLMWLSYTQTTTTESFRTF